jgi:hypothetical protein
MPVPHHSLLSRNRCFNSLISIIIAILQLSSLLFAQDTGTRTEKQEIHSKSYPLPSFIYLGEKEKQVRRFLAKHPDAAQSKILRKTNWPFSVGSTYAWYADNLETNNRYQVPSTCRAIGTHCYVFVEDSSWGTRVRQSAVDSVRIYFDQKTPANPSKGIFQMDVDAFGNPPDVDGDPRIIILLLDIKDGYNGSGGYVVGYFHPFNEMSRSQPGYATSNEAEIYFLDTHPLDLQSEEGLQEGISTTAHEFQHMINFNYYHGERETFINEGCSLVAEVNCGYPIFNQMEYVNETNHYLLDWRSNDMTAVLRDYARAARYFVYLRDQAGIQVFQPLVASTSPDQRGIDEGLASIGNPLRFNNLTYYWFLANCINDTIVDPFYGYRYPHLPKASSIEYYVPNTSGTNCSVERYAVQYYSYLGGSQIKATFSSMSAGFLVKAIETGSGGTRVLDVPANMEFSEPGFGTIYTQIHFAVIDTDGFSPARYSYTTSGNGGVAVTSLSYASSAQYYILLPSSNQKFAVRFTPTASGQLYGVTVDLNGRTNAILGNGNLLLSGHQNNPLGSVAGIPAAQIGTSISVPFRQLTYGRNSIDMKNAHIMVTQGIDFHVVVEVAGAVGDTLQFLLDDGVTSPTNRTSSYRTGSNGQTWYNRADPLYGSGKPPSYENLLLSATIGSATTDTISPDTTRRIVLRDTLEQNFPNPCKEYTKIKYTLSQPCPLTISIYDVVGRLVAVPVSGWRDSNTELIRLDNLPSGIYFYRIKAGKFIDTKKMVVLK